MSFLNTFSEISRNRGNFRQWEQDKADEEAQREKYFAQNPASQEEQKEAAEFGRVVVDTVELMDTQSENKSESVENATEMTTSFASIAAMIGVQIHLGKKALKQHQEIEPPLENIKKLAGNLINYDKSKQHPQAEAIVEDLNKNKLLSHYKSGDKMVFLKHDWIHGTPKILEQHKWENLSDETKKYFGSAVNEDLLKKVKGLKGNVLKNIAIPALVAFGVGIAGQIIGTIAQIKASRIARFQAREDIGDTRNFVEYTDAQKAEAKKIAEGIKVPDEKKSGSIKDIISLKNDYSRYQQHSAEMDNIHLQDIPEEDPEKAYKKQKIINNAIKKINNQAEDYSENMETAASVILGSSVLGGLAFGKLADFIIKKFDKTPNIEEAENAAENAGKEIGKEAEKVIPKKNVGKQILHFAKKNPTVVGTILSTIIGGIIATKMQKEASRAGRYEAKKELEEHPENFIYADKLELSKTGETGTVKKEGVLDVFKFVPKSIRTIMEYDKYKKTTLKQKKAYQEALKRVQVSDAQMQKADALKLRLYKSFDVIDDHSEEYSEKMEAAGEIGKNIIGTLQSLAIIAPIIVAVKYPNKVAKHASTIIAGVFKNFNGFAKKYTKGLGNHLTKALNSKIEDTRTFEHLKFAEQDINEALLSANDKIFGSRLEALRPKLEQKLGEENARKYLEQITQHRLNIGAPTKDMPSDEELSKGLNKLFGTESNMGIMEKLLQKSGLELTDAPENIQKWRKLFVDKAENLPISEKSFEDMKDEDIKKIISNIKTFSEKVPEKEIIEAFAQTETYLQNNPMKSMIIRNENIELSTAETFLSKDIKPVAYGVMGLYGAGVIGSTYAIESYMSSETKKAGRIGTMKAIQQLDDENEQAKTKTQPSTK